MDASPAKSDDGLGLADFLPNVSAGYTAHAGAALATSANPADVAAIEAALKRFMIRNSGQYF